MKVLLAPIFHPVFPKRLQGSAEIQQAWTAADMQKGKVWWMSVSERLLNSNVFLHISFYFPSNSILKLFKSITTVDKFI